MTQEKAMPRPNSQCTDPQRKPRLALMGEFSAGKSTLTNLLVGRQLLPVRVTATRLPPVWISYGDEAAYIVTTDGNQIPVSLEDLDIIEMETTAMIRLFYPSDALELCDIIDMPGISDPNMPPEKWQSLIPEVDGVMWCTHATQAWRQSEAAVWESIADAVDGPNILLITHFDKLRSERDRGRVTARICKEAGPMFDRVFPISLSQALLAGDDMDAWRNSGADKLIEYLVETLLNRPQGDRVSSAPDLSQPADNGGEQPLQAEVFAIDTSREQAEQRQAEQRQAEQAESAASLDADYVVPRRVRAKRRGQRPQPCQPELENRDD